MDAGGDDDNSGTKQPELWHNPQDDQESATLAAAAAAAAADDILASLGDSDKFDDTSSESSAAVLASLKVQPFEHSIQPNQLHNPQDDQESATLAAAAAAADILALLGDLGKFDGTSSESAAAVMASQKVQSFEHSTQPNQPVDDGGSFEYVACPHCDNLFVQGALQSHKKECIFNLEIHTSTKAFCPHCHVSFLQEDLETHSNECHYNQSTQHSRSASLAVEAKKEELESHKNQCSPHRRPHSLAEEKKSKQEKVEADMKLLKAKKDKIEADLKVLRDRMAKASNVIVMGPKQSGKSTLTNCLSTHLCRFIDPDGVFSTVSIADYVMYVFDSSKDNAERFGSFEVAFYFDIKPLVCCFNKMDLVSDPEEVYKSLKLQLFGILTEYGYDADEIPCVPISVSMGWNITEKTSNFEWYEGPTLLEAVNKRLDHSRHLSKPKDALRVAVHGVLESGNITAVVHSGTLFGGQSVIISPGKWTTEVEEISINTGPVSQAFPGEMVDVKLKASPEATTEVKRGSVISCLNSPAKETQGLTTKVRVIGNNTLEASLVGKILRYHTDTTLMNVSEISCRLMPVSYEIIESYPSLLKRSHVGIVRLTTVEPITVEKITDYPSLSRIIIRNRQDTEIVALGVVTDVDKRSLGSSDSEKHYLVVSDPLPFPPKSKGDSWDPKKGDSGEGTSVKQEGDSDEEKTGAANVEEGTSLEQEGDSDEEKTGAAGPLKRKTKKKKKTTKKKRGGRH